MMGKVITTISGDAQQLVDAQKAVAAGAKEMGDEYKRVDKELDILSSKARKTFRDTRTDLEQYNAKLGDLNEMLKAGKIGEETYARAVAQATAEYRKKSSIIEQATSKLGTMVTSGVAGFLSLTAGAAALRTVLAGVRDEADKLGEAMEADFFSRGMLMQIAQGGTLGEKQADFQKLAAQADYLLRTGTTTSQATANKLSFSLRSTEQESDLETFAEIGRRGMVEDLESLINATDSLKDAFGRKQTGTAEQLISKAMAAGGASQTDMLQIAVNAAKVAGHAAPLGVSDETVLGAVGGMTDPLTSPETAAARLGEFFKKASKLKTKSKDLYGIVDEISKIVETTGKTPLELMEGEAAAAFNLLKLNRESIQESIRRTQAANDPKDLREKLQAAKLDERLGPTAELRAAAGSEQAALAESGIGSLENLRDAVAARYAAVNIARGQGGIRRSLSRTRVGLTQLLGGGLQLDHPDLLRQESREAAAAGNVQLQRALDDLINVQTQALDLAKRQEAERRGRLRKPAVPAPEG